MADRHDVAVLVGSLRRDSLSGRVAHALGVLAPPRLSLHVVPIGELALYSQDYDAAPPAPYVAFRDAIRAAAGVLFVTPEYNRSIPGGLKNALDVGSRPYGHSVFNGKPAAIVSQAPGAIGGFGANHVLRQSLAYLNMPVMQQPEAYLSHSDKLVDAAGNVTNDTTRDFLAGFMEAFAALIDRYAGRPGG